HSSTPLDRSTPASAGKFRQLRRGALPVVTRRHGVLDDLAADCLHRQAFELVWTGRVTFDARQGATAQLLGALRRDVHKQESARDHWGVSRRLILRRISAGCFVNHGASLYGFAGLRSAVCGLLPSTARRQQSAA